MLRALLFFALLGPSSPARAEHDPNKPPPATAAPTPVGTRGTSGTPTEAGRALGLRRSDAAGQQGAQNDCACGRSKARGIPAFLPLGLGGALAALAQRTDSLLPNILPPALVEIESEIPLTAVEGQTMLAVGLPAPNTATALPTLLLVSALLVLGGAWMVRPLRLRVRNWRTGRVLRVSRRRGGFRESAGWGLVGAGSLLLLLSVQDYVSGEVAQRSARAEWRAASAVALAAAAAQDPRDSAAAALLPVAPLVQPVAFSSERSGLVIGRPVARLRIPRLDLDEIVIEGVGAAQLNMGPGHFPGSVLPGGVGNSIISAHRDRHFHRFGEIVVGDTIVTETADGERRWVVGELRVVDRAKPALFDERTPTLTLTTCWPVRYFGPAPERLLVVARPADAAVPAVQASASE
jgi:LPXTG-site transpeptidase (sortase) family protein